MLRTRSLLICLTAVTLSLAGIALGKAVKQDLVNENGDVIGKANINYAKGENKTEVQANCWDMDPETDYTVFLCECNEDEITDCIELGSFTRVEGDYPDWCVVVGTVSDDGVVTPCGWWGINPGWPLGPFDPFLPGPIPIFP